MSSSNNKPERPERPLVTGKLNADQRRAIIIPALGSFDTRFTTTDVVYHPVPFNYKTIPNPHPWRILLKFGAPAPRIVVGLDVYGDVILGRGSGGPQSPDIDLSNLDALALGVSRRHALLRPTQNKLFLIDLDSTNGSYVNAIPVGRGMAQVLKGGDTVALAGLNFVIEIVRAPKASEEKPVTEREEQTAPRSTTLKIGEQDAKKEEDDLIANLPLPPMARPRQGQKTVPPGKVPGLAQPPPSAEGEKDDTAVKKPALSNQKGESKTEETKPIEPSAAVEKGTPEASSPTPAKATSQLGKPSTPPPKEDAKTAGGQAADAPEGKDKSAKPSAPADSEKKDPKS